MGSKTLTGFSWVVIRMAVLSRHNFGNPLCALLMDSVGYVVFAIILCKLSTILRRATLDARTTLAGDGAHNSPLGSIRTLNNHNDFVGQALRLPAIDAVALQVCRFKPRE